MISVLYDPTLWKLASWLSSWYPDPGIIKNSNQAQKKKQKTTTEVHVKSSIAKGARACIDIFSLGRFFPLNHFLLLLVQTVSNTMFVGYCVLNTWSSRYHHHHLDPENVNLSNTIIILNKNKFSMILPQISQLNPTFSNLFHVFPPQLPPPLC